MSLLPLIVPRDLQIPTTYVIMPLLGGHDPADSWGDEGTCFHERVLGRTEFGALTHWICQGCGRVFHEEPPEESYKYMGSNTWIGREWL